jgi:hypothetical protein
MRVKQAFEGLKTRFCDRIDRLKNHVLLFNPAPHQAEFHELSSTTLEQENTVITGFNTDVEHDGVTYHVQTEDKGLKSPLILSLVYVGGTILASKRTPYDDLIADGFDEAKLAERLQRQHKLICAAIHAGRIEDLKRQTERDAGVRAKAPEPEEQKSVAPEIIQPKTIQAETAPQKIAQEDPDIIQTGSLADFMPPSVFMSPPAVKNEPAAAESNEAPLSSQIDHVDYSRVVDYDGAISHADDLRLSLLDEKRFVAGEFVKINVHVGSATESPESISDATVTLKVLGSSFRPLIFSGKTGADGTATFYAMLPYFTSGRAAILINAMAKGYRAELRRVIHQA